MNSGGVDSSILSTSEQRASSMARDAQRTLWQRREVSSTLGGWLWLGSALLLLVVFGSFVRNAMPVLNFEYDVNYVEGVLVDQARRVTEGTGLYPPFDQPPYVVDNYGPVYPYLVSWLPRGPTPFYTGRLISMIATLVTCAMLALFVRRYAGDAAGLLAASCFLISPEVQRFGAMMRVDALALALGSSGLLMITRRGRGWVVAGCVAFFLCIYTRHSMMMFPLLGSVLYLLREKLRGSLPLAYLLGVGVVAFVIGDVTTDGRMHEHLVSFNLLEYRWEDTVGRWMRNYWSWRMLLMLAVWLALCPAASGSALDRDLAYRRLLYFGAVIVGGLLVVHFALACAGQDFSERGGAQWNFFRRMVAGASLPEAPQWSLVGFFVMIVPASALLLFRWTFKEARAAVETDPEGLQGLLGVVSIPIAMLIGKAGADVNYLIEPLIAWIVVAVLALRRGRLRWRGLIVCLLIVYVAIGAYSNEVERPTHPDRLRERADSSRKIVHEVHQILQANPGPILSEEPLYPALLGFPLEYQRFIYSQLIAAGDWDPEPLLQDIRRRKFSAVIRIAIQPYAGLENGTPRFGPIAMARDGFPKVIRDALGEFYQPLESSRAVYRLTPWVWFHTMLWVPKEM